MRRVLGRLVAACVVALSLSGPLADRGSADPFAGAQAARRAAEAAPLIDKVHGFHCRKALGWDPVAGVYHVHRHEGICRNYQRCLYEHKRCIFILGRGFEPWTYERFGWDNWQYTACMVRSGCY